MVLLLSLQHYLLYSNNLLVDFDLELPVQQGTKLDMILSFFLSLYIEDAGSVPSLIPPVLPLH